MWKGKKKELGEERHVYGVEGREAEKTWLKVVKNDREELGLDALYSHTWGRKIADSRLPRAPWGSFQVGLLNGVWLCVVHLWFICV